MDELLEKRKNEAERLNRRRRAAADTSIEIISRREAFFDRLALLNAGALTFSVTLLSNAGLTSGLSWPLFLYIAWGLILLAMAACLGRNLFHQHFQMSDVMTKMAESEIAYLDVDLEIMNSGIIGGYSDSAEPFDLQRETTVNRSNRDDWQRSLTDHQRKVKRNWGLVVAAEWIAGISMLMGFACLIAFAVRNIGHGTHTPRGAGLLWARAIVVLTNVAPGFFG
ncbi:MAG: hypothetical protein JWN74_102 [Acidobacteriaceae bacterium]|nr:hypothetical protein [Acidobacteriaceae bacterium]